MIVSVCAGVITGSAISPSIHLTGHPHTTHHHHDDDHIMVILRMMMMMKFTMVTMEIWATLSVAWSPLFEGLN